MQRGVLPHILMAEPTARAPDRPEETEFTTGHEEILEAERDSVDSRTANKGMKSSQTGNQEQLQRPYLLGHKSSLTTISDQGYRPRILPESVLCS